MSRPLASFTPGTGNSLGYGSGYGGLPDSGGELVESLTYRHAYIPAVPVAAPSRPARRLLAEAPPLLRAAAGGAWALVSVAAAGCVLLVLVLLVTRIVGWLT